MSLHNQRSSIQPGARQSDWFLQPLRHLKPPEIAAVFLGVALHVAPGKDALRKRWLDGQTLAAFGAARCDNRAATAGLHAGKKAVRTCALDFGGLVCAFHDMSSCLLDGGFWSLLTDIRKTDNYG